MKQIIGLLLFFGSCFSLALNYKFAGPQGKVTFLAQGKPALISIKGQGQGLTGSLVHANQVLSGQITFPLTSLTTGIELRDQHLKDKYLEVEKYPLAHLTLSQMKLPSDLTKEFEFAGTLNFHGVDQHIEGFAKLILNATSTTDFLMARFTIKLSQFQIAIPSFQGITVAENVLVTVEAPVEKSE